MAAAGKKLGEILVEEGLITPIQLDEILANQKKTGNMFGKMAVMLGYTKESEIIRALQKQAGGTKTDQGKKIKNTCRRPIGEILIAIGAINQAQLNEALNEQDAHAWSNKLLGEILIIDKGCLHPQQLKMALDIQRREQGGEDDPNPYLTTKAHVTLKDITQRQSPDLVIAISGVYGEYGLGPNQALESFHLFRQEDESDGALVERATQELKPILLQLLSDNEARQQFEKSQLHVECSFNNYAEWDAFPPPKFAPNEDYQPTIGDNELLTEENLGTQPKNLEVSSDDPNNNRFG